MEQKHENDSFRYTYSAREQAELKKIREKYTPRETAENKMERVRRLDRKVTKKALTISLILGILGALTLGLGMSLAMTELGALLGIQGSITLPLAIVIGTVGILLSCLAYPIYQLTLKKERKRIAPEILRLTDELMK